MNYPEYQADLDRTYASEVFGETVFATAARLTRSPVRRAKWRRLQDLEIQTKKRVEEFLDANREHVTPPAFAKTKGILAGSLLALLPWSISMKMLGDGTAPFLLSFERLERNAVEASKPFFRMSSPTSARSPSLQAASATAALTNPSTRSGACSSAEKRPCRRCRGS